MIELVSSKGSKHTAHSEGPLEGVLVVDDSDMRAPLLFYAFGKKLKKSNKDSKHISRHTYNKQFSIEISDITHDLNKQQCFLLNPLPSFLTRTCNNLPFSRSEQATDSPRSV